MQPSRVDSQVAREQNRSIVFELLRSHSAVSRVALARETGLSKATISQIVDHFIREGFVREMGPGESSGGRRPTLLHLEPRARSIIGVELSDTAGSGMLVDLNGQPIHTVSRQIRAISPDDALATAGELIAELIAREPREKLLGIGIGTPGLVDSREGVIQVAPDLGWRSVPVGPLLHEQFALPVAVVNRAKAAALGEAWSGAGAKIDNLVYVSVSTGISAGIVHNQRLYRGVSMSEGELGHVTILPDGPLCACGNRGCLQTLVSGPTLLARVRELLRGRGSNGPNPSSYLSGLLAPNLLTLETVAAAAAGGDPIADTALTEAAEFLGIAVANLLNILNPAMLVLGGSVIEAVPSLVPLVEEVIRRRTMTIPAAAAPVKVSRLGRSAVPIGAAAFLFTHVSDLGQSLNPVDVARLK